MMHTDDAQELQMQFAYVQKSGVYSTTQSYKMHRLQGYNDDPKLMGLPCVTAYA